MAIVAEFTKATIQPAGLMAVMKGETLYLNAGGGGATAGFQSILYRLPVRDFRRRRFSTRCSCARGRV